MKRYAAASLQTCRHTIQISRVGEHALQNAVNSNPARLLEYSMPVQVNADLTSHVHESAATC